MKKNSPYKTLNHEIHYLSSFIGGSMEVTSFLFFFKALIGFMTSNLIFGVVALTKREFDFESMYHILIIVIWMIFSALHQYIYMKLSDKLISPWHLYAVAMTLNCFLLILFIIGGVYLANGGYLSAGPIPAIIPVVTVGLLFMYIQNFIIQHGGSAYPCSTSVVTSVYVLCLSSYVKACHKKESAQSRAKSVEAGNHYLFVLLHFIAGALLTALLSSYIGFYALLLSLVLLIWLTFRLWRAHSHDKVQLETVN